MISRKRLVEFWQEHPDAKGPLTSWFREVKHARWTSTADIKAAYRSADFVGNDRIVFNIGGNKYRLVVCVKEERPSRFRNPGGNCYGESRP